MTYVVDASVLLAIIEGEPGGDLALQLSRGSDMSWLNIGEVLSKVVDRGGDPLDAMALLHELDLKLHDFGERDAEAVAGMLPLTRHVGLSFGDRACLALGKRLNLVVLTAERRWLNCGVGIEVRLLR